MQSQHFVNYRAIIEAFSRANSRGVAVFKQIYGLDEKFMFSLLLRKDWHRWYLFKKCVHHLEKHAQGTEIAVCMNLSKIGLRMAHESLKKACPWLKETETTKHLYS